MTNKWWKDRLSCLERHAFVSKNISVSRHDFDPTHGGNGNPGSNIRGCEGTGLMSYGSKQNPRNSYAVPIAWSTCSNLDFAKWYRSDGHKCLRPGADDTGDTGKD